MYVPPKTREEATAEIMHSGFTISAMLAVSLAFPLDGELEDTLNDRLGQMMLQDYGEGACHYLYAWGRNKSDVR